MPEKSKFKSFIYLFERNFLKLKLILGERQFLYLSAVCIAISVAIAVILLKTFAHYVYQFSQYLNSKLHLPFSTSIFPVIGILLTLYIIKKFLDGKLEKGTWRIMYAVAKKRSVLPAKQMFAQIITSSFTVGLGGSAGLESPITITGAAFGSNFALKYHFNYKDRTLLLACGVAAGIGAAFNAPIAGVLFAIEVVLAEISISAFTPLIISAATGALISAILLKDEILFNFKNVTPFHYKFLFFYIILGVLCGIGSIFYARNFRKLEHYFSRKQNKGRRKVLGLLVIGILIFIFPPLFGEGYESIKYLAHNNPEILFENSIFETVDHKKWIIALLVLLIAFVKVFATATTIGTGGNGGNFAPSLFVGAFLGFSVAYLVNLTGFVQLPISSFTLVGMSGVLSGLFHAPLTGIFLIAEITGGYNLMIPLMLISSISYAISKKYEPYSFDIKNLADKGEVFTDDKDKNILLSIDIQRLIDTKFTIIQDNKTLEQLIERIKISDSVLFPVLNDNNQLSGIVYFDDIRPKLFSQNDIANTTVKEVMQKIKFSVSLNESVENILDKFEQSNKIILPVINDNNFLGFISKASILESYRAKLKEIIVE